MTLQAVELCHARGIPFSQTFDQQWVLSRRPLEDIPGYSSQALGAWHLQHGRSLPMAFAEDKGRGWSAAVLGLAVDAEGAVIDEAGLAAHLRAAEVPEALAQTLEMCGGRFAFVIVAPGLERLYLDPSGCLGAVFDPVTKLAGATLFMTLERAVVPDTTYPLHDIAASAQGGRFAFGVTPDRDVRRLMCNHYLDLETFSPVRHWPSAIEDLTCGLTVDEIEGRIETIIQRHHQILHSLVRHVKPAMLPLSGGADARLLLAFCKPVLDQLDLVFVHRTNWNTLMDTKIAEKLALLAGVPLRRIDVIDDQSLQKSRRFAARMNARQQLAQGFLDGGAGERKREIEVRQALPIGGMVLRGNVTDLSKAVLWRQRGINEFVRTRGHSHDPELGVRLLMLGGADAQKDHRLKAQYAEWYGSLPECARGRAIDFASLEHFRSHGQGAFFYMTNRNFYVTPSADRTILRALISLPPHIRAAFYINDIILERTAPEFRDVPYTRKVDNDIRASRPPLEEVLRQARQGGERM
jgi:hypothetical protein